MKTIFSQTEVDVIEDIEEYQTIPGVIILILRIIVMLCFILSLRDTMSHEYNPDRLHFFLHFGAASLVRMCNLSERKHPDEYFFIHVGLVYLFTPDGGCGSPNICPLENQVHTWHNLLC